MDLPELALRFTLASPAVSTVIPGMRRTAHVDRNFAGSDGKSVASGTLTALRQHRWERSVDIE
jgi:aryl-alcohol dehydrogenase-like predicted oxidoreductase